MGAEGILFTFILVVEVALLFSLCSLLSNFECNFFTATTCCERLNYWVLPKAIAHDILALLLLLTGHWLLFIMYAPLSGWITYRIVMKPSGDLGVFDPTKVSSRQQVHDYLNESLTHMAVHLFFIFIFLYCMINSLVKGL